MCIERGLKAWYVQCQCRKVYQKLPLSHQISISFQGDVRLLPSYISTGSGLSAKHQLPAPAQGSSVCGVPASGQTRFGNHCSDIWAVNLCMNQCPAHCPCWVQNRELTHKSRREELYLVFAKQSQSPCLKLMMGPVEEQVLDLQMVTSKHHSLPGTE